MAFLNNINQMRSVTWGAKYLWDIKFDGAPAPFDTWFPAVDVDEDLAKVESFAFDGYLSSFSIPKRTGLKNIKVTFHDDASHTLLTWMTNWINVGIFNNGQYVSVLEKSVKLLQLLKLDHKRSTIKTSNYLVYPEDNLVFNGSSSSDSQIYSVNFVIAG